MFEIESPTMLRHRPVPVPREVSRHQVLDRAKAQHDAARVAECEVLVAAVEWAELHPTTDQVDSAVFWCEGHAVPIAGPGAPLVAEWAVEDFAATLGLKSEHGLALMGEAVEIAFRLPRLWTRVRTGEVPVWKARRIARSTMDLSLEAAGFVDAQVSWCATRIGVAALDRLIADARARFMPAEAERIRQEAMDRRRVEVDHRQISFAGTCRVFAELDFGDAQDLDQALTAGAEALLAAGSTEKTDVRRALALGDLARGETPLPLTRDEETGETAGETSRPGVARRQVVLHVHLSEAAVTGLGSDIDAPSRHGRVEGTGSQGGRHLVTAETIRGWCGTAGQVRVVPVVDLEDHIQVEAYEIPDRLHAQVKTRDLHCIFPWCEKPAAACDSDHVIPHDAGGPTASDNLAPLCRRHHRLKTTGRWWYQVLRPGTYLWHAPYDRTYLVDHTGTTHGSRTAGPEPAD